tara:strand:+ start:49 stop:531 length:483 start_codon:yes stop_codon:yes gene_type:complete
MFAKSLKLHDIKDKTITGSMAYAGGPLNSYVLHSTAKLIENIRRNNGTGIITGVSGMMTKQSYALWSKNPEIDFVFRDFTEEAKIVDQPIELSNLEDGEGKIIGYTIIDKKNISKAIMYLNTSNDKRKLITSSDKTIIDLMEKKEWVGKKVKFKRNQLVL